MQNRPRSSQVSRRGFVQASAGLGASALALGGAPAAWAQDASPAAIPEVTPRGGDTVSFSYLRPTWGPATFTKDGPYQQQLQELGNVEIEVQIIPVIDFDTRINTVLASGDLPDVMWGGGPSQQIWKDAQDQGAFAPINQYLEQFPAVKAAVPDSFWELLTDESGNIYFIPNLIYPVVPFFIFYRKDIFDAKGIAEPTNLDEFVAACEALAGDPEVSPLTMGYTWHAKDFATVWDFAEFGWQPNPEDENQIIPWFTQEPQKEMHFWFQDMYSRQLLDQNYGINPEPNLSDDRFKGGQSAIALANWAGFTEFQTNLWQIDPNATVAVMDPISETAGTRMVFPIDRGFYVAASYDNPEGFFAFLEWSLTGGTTFRRYGIEGETYNVVDGDPVPIPDVERAPEYQGPQIEPLRFLDPMSEKLDWAAIQRNFEGGGVGDQFEYIKGKFETYAVNQFFDYRNTMIISPTDGENGSRLYEDYLRSTIDSVIINADTTREDWDNAVTEWRGAGGDDIINEVNELQTDKAEPDYGVS
jgi:putative aldouronate transport system substrate-binding protein